MSPARGAEHVHPFREEPEKEPPREGTPPTRALARRSLRRPETVNDHSRTPVPPRARRLASPLALVALGIFSAFGCSSDPSPQTVTASTGSDLIGGSPATAQGTGALYFETGSWACSGVMIAPNKILTAAHCVANVTKLDETTYQYDGTVAAAFLKDGLPPISNSNVIAPTGTYWATPKIVDTDLHPDFKAACKSKCVNFWANPPYASDLAIVTFDEAFPACFGQPATLGTASIGDVVTKDGYGCTIQGQVTSQNTFKEAVDTIVPATTTTAPAIKDSTAYGLNYFVTGASTASICPGDSGGPLFKGTVTNGGTVVAINSHTDYTNNGFARLDSATTQQWLAKNLGSNSLPATPPLRGSPVNSGADPVSLAFPLSTVEVETAGRVCTGVILSSIDPTTKDEASQTTLPAVLTAAHCRPDTTSKVTFFGKGLGNTDIGTTIPVSAVSFPPGLVCNPAITGSFPDTCSMTGSSGGTTYADLAVLTLASDVPDGYVPVVLSSLDPNGDGTGPNMGNPSWQVAASRSGLQWTTTFDVATSSTDGSFAVQSVFGLPSDGGGPLFQYPNGAASSDGPLVLVGVASAIGPCAVACDYTALDCNSHVDTFTSVRSSDIYAWLLSHGGSTAPPMTTFGTGE